MFEEGTILYFYFLEPILIYFCISRFTTRYLTYTDTKKPKSKYDKVPCRLIRKHFNLQKKEMHIETYIFLIFQYMLLWRIWIVPILGVFSGFNTYVTIIICIIHLASFIIYDITMIIVHCFFAPKIKIKKKRIFKGLKHELEIAQAIFSRDQRKWEVPLLNKLDKFEHKQKGVKYIPSDSVKHIETKILIPNKKHVYYEVKADEHGCYELLVFSKKDNRIIFQSPIRKK